MWKHSFNLAASRLFCMWTLISPYEMFKCDNRWNTKRPHCCCFLHLSFLVDVAPLAMLPSISTFPVYCLHQPTLCPQLLSLLFYVKLLSFWTPTLARTCTPRAPRCGVGFQTFRAEGRISFSKCLAGKYVTRVETDPVKNRWDVFKRATGVCAICFLPSHTHSEVKSVSLLSAEVLSARSKQPWSRSSEICC